MFTITKKLCIDHLNTFHLNIRKISVKIFFIRVNFIIIVLLYLLYRKFICNNIFNIILYFILYRFFFKIDIKLEKICIRNKKLLMQYKNVFI